MLSKIRDVREATLITLKKCSEILGLTYHTTRNLLYNDNSIGYVDYGRKKLWVLEEILEYKRKHYVKAKAA